MKKVGTVPTGKSGSSGLTGKSSSKIGTTLSSRGKLPTVPTVSSKSYSSSSYNTPKSKKSTTFGIIWFPGKKRNKHKELIYNSHKNEGTGDRAPSMYNLKQNSLVSLCLSTTKMQENNNFETIISKWRRLSVVEQISQKDSVALSSMSGDSSSQQTFLKKKEEESDLLAPERSGYIPVAVAGTGAVTATEIPPDIVNANPEEKQEFIKRDNEDNKVAAGDTNDNDKSDRDYLENEERDKKNPDSKTEKEKLTDNVDSVFLRSRPPHKTQSTASTVEEEDCGVKCLYYTLECCDCVLM